MKRIIIYALLTAIALLIPERGTDVGKLIPAELVYVYMEGEQVVVTIDTEHFGTGATIDVAIKNLFDTTPGKVFLDTADYLLLTEETRDLLGTVDPYLKGNVKVCLAEKGIDVKAAVQYLAVHQPEGTVKNGICEKLVSREGRYILTEKL